MKGSRAGALYAIAAYGLWGVVPIYWKLLNDVPAIELLAHRVVWSAVFVAILVVAMRKLAEARAAFTPRTLAYLGASTVLIGATWGLFIWAVQTNRILQASLGYYVNPLVNVLLGVVVLGERLRRPQVIAVGLAALGVIVMAVQKGALPWISIVLAGTFAAYGLLRKTAPVDALAGLLVETVLLVPFAVAFVWLRGTVVARSAPSHLVLLACAGPVTALPLLFFTAAARRLPLSTLGFFQYLSPTLQFLLAVLVYGERLTAADVIAFAAIWIALFVFTRGTPRAPHVVR